MTSNTGYASVPYDNLVARSTYLAQLPMLAECLRFERFRTEMETLLTSISQQSVLVTKFTDVFPSILPFLSIDHQFQIIYVSGEKLCAAAEEKVKNAFLAVAENMLQGIGQIEKEFKDFILPQLDLSGPQTGRFAVWRLARLSVLVDDFSPFQDAMFQVFSKHDITNACEVLTVMKKDFAPQYIAKALMCASAQAHIYAINAIELFEIDVTGDAVTSLCLMNEKEPSVLKRLVELPPKMLPLEMLKKLLEDSSVNAKAATAALASPFFEQLLPKLIEQGGVGCELNCVDFQVLKKCKPVPYEFLAMLLKVSKEILKQETIKEILSLDRDEILYKLVFPRMGEEGSWRSRFNAIEIFRGLLMKGEKWDSEEQQLKLSEYAGFVVAMCLDHVYSVREAAFETLSVFPPGDARLSVVNSLFSLAVDTIDDSQKSILRQMLKKTRAVIVESCEKDRVMEIMKLVNMEDPKYFDLKH